MKTVEELIPCEFNEEIEIDGTDVHADTRHYRYLLQRGLNWASFYGNGQAIEIVKTGISLKEKKAFLHLRVTVTKLEIE